nr:DUF373 family protein [Vulcanisaeta sp. JCM 16159]
MSKLVRRLIVLYVDRDNDVGERLGVPTPIIGRNNVLKVLRNTYSGTQMTPMPMPCSALFSSMTL